MVLSELISWLRDSVKFIIEHSPYPLKVAFWLFAFFSFAGVLSFFFSIGVACSADGVAYTPDNPYWAFKIEWERAKLSNNINWTVYNNLNESINIYQEPAWWDRVYNSLIYIASFGTIQNFDLEGNPLTYGSVRYINDENISIGYDVNDVYDAQQAKAYNEFVREHSTLKYYSDSEVVSVTCDRYNPKLRVFGIDIMDKTLWIVLSVIVILAPYLAMALNRRT